MKYGYFIIIIAAVFNAVETSFFGNNWKPSCIAEVYADGISGIMFAMGFLTLAIEKKKK